MENVDFVIVLWQTHLQHCLYPLIEVLFIRRIMGQRPGGQTGRDAFLRDVDARRAVRFGELLGYHQFLVAFRVDVSTAVL